jgi:hypothetical protein
MYLALIYNNMELNQKETRHVAGAGWLSSTKAFV